MKTLMIQGTTSDAGKSTLVAGLCRVLANQGVNVAPFKPQNMALNSAVTEDGGEIGRAQALQAIAAKTPLQTDFNPILLKPNSDTGAQVIIHGKAISNMEAETYHDYKKVAMDAVVTSHQRLSQKFDVLMVEGAGSPAEINLRENDIANMGYAEKIDCPVIIIADIDKGGVFAHLVGTLALLSPSEQNRVKGFVINRFRGDIALLQSGLDWLEEYTNKPVLGVLPYLHDLSLDAEDAISINNVVTEKRLTIAVLLLPHVSNHTDFDPLALHPEIDFSYIRVGETIPPLDLLIIPGSKNVISDLHFLKEQQWDKQLQRHLRYGGKVLGICGGYQMLGNEILDPDEIESKHQRIEGLGLLDITTTLTPTKSLQQVTGTLHLQGETSEFSGYEIHCGVSTGKALNDPIISLSKSSADGGTFDGCLSDGCTSDDKQILGTYVHGIFDQASPTKLILNWVSEHHGISDAINIDEHREIQLEKLAATCEQHLNMNKIKQILNEGNTHD